MDLQLQNPKYWLQVDKDFLLRFFRLAIINILSNLIVPLSSLLSVAFLGHLAGIQHLAGVTLSGIVFNYLYRTLSFLRMGTTGVTAQAVGRKDEETVWLTGLRNVCLAIGLGIAIVALQYPLKIISFYFLNADLDVKLAAQAYYDTRIWGVPAALLNFVLIGWFLGREQSAKVLILSIVGNGANILLDYLLIMRWGLESTGAGLAAALSQIITCLVGFLLILPEIKGQEWKQLFKKLGDRSAFKDIIGLNSNIFIRTLAFLSIFSLFTALSASFGTDILTENALLLQVITIAVYLIDGLAYATECITGIFKGQNNYEKLIPLLQIAGITSLVLGLVCAGAFVGFPNILFGLLTNHQEIIIHLNHYVFWLLPVLGFGSIAFMLDGYFLGLAESAKLRNAAITAALIGFVPMIIAWQWQSCTWLWLSLTVFMVARVILLAVQIPATLK